MFKKLIVSGAAAALVFGAAAGAFADFHLGSNVSLNVTNTGSNVSNSINTSSNTGNNSLTAYGHWAEVENSYVNTGVSTSGLNLQSQLNWNNFTLSLSGLSHLDLDLYNQGTLSNSLTTSANSGYNSITGHYGAEVEGSHVSTGNAGSSSVVTNIVNTNTLHVTTSQPTFVRP